MNGPIQISSIEGNQQWLDGGAMFGNAPRALWSRWIQPDEQGRIPLSCRAMLIETSDRKILFETGIGDFFEPKLRDRFGVESGGHLLLKNLKRGLGLDPEEITDVVLSHLHFDHAGGMLSSYGDGEQRLVFNRAQYYVGESAWKRANHPHSRDRASFVPELNRLMEESGRLNIVRDSEDRHSGLPDWIRFIRSEGHTPGQLHAVVEGERSSVFFAGDLVPGTHWVHVPITMGYDRFPEALIDEKQKLLDEWSKSKNWIFFTHDSKVSMSQILFNGKKFEPTEVQEQLTRFEI